MLHINNEMPYEEFVPRVWKAINLHQIEQTEFTPAIITLLGQTKPLLLKKALEAKDPRVAPYPLKEFLEFLKTNWNSFNRPEKEFSN